MAFEVTIANLDVIVERLGAFGELIDDYDPLWDEYEDIMSDVELQWFATGSEHWEALAPATVREKQRYGFADVATDPLIRTGQLMEELSDPLQAARRTTQHLSWGTDDEVADYHESGRTSPNPMPARPVMERPPSPATIARFEEANRIFVRDRAAEAGLLSDVFVGDTQMLRGANPANPGQFSGGVPR